MIIKRPLTSQRSGQKKHPVERFGKKKSSVAKPNFFTMFTMNIFGLCFWT